MVVVLSQTGVGLAKLNDLDPTTVGEGAQLIVKKAIILSRIAAEKFVVLHNKNLLSLFGEFNM